MFGKQHIGGLQHRHEPAARQQPCQNWQFGQPVGVGKHRDAHQHLTIGCTAMNLRHGGLARDVVTCGFKPSLGDIDKGQLALRVAALQEIYLSHTQWALAVVVQREFGRGGDRSVLHGYIG